MTSFIVTEINLSARSDIRHLKSAAATAAAAAAAAASRPLARGAHERASELEPQVRPCLAVDVWTLMCILMPVQLQTSWGPEALAPPPSIGDAAPDGEAGSAAGPPSDGGGEVQCHRPPGKGVAKSRVAVPVHTLSVIKCIKRPTQCQVNDNLIC